tara:strand:+ start:4035 stop:4655 length:621 start_codon:yes stop_codon:yes gene_type:complete
MENLLPISKPPPPPIIEEEEEQEQEEQEELEDEVNLEQDKEIIIPEEVFKKRDLFLKTELKNVPVVKKEKKTRKMTPEGLEKLAKAREKALETRKKNKELRAQGKMPMPSVKKKAIQDEEIEKARPIVNNYKTENITNNITHEDIKKIALQASQDALLGYEEKRLLQKEEKRKQKELNNQKTHVRNVIRRAQGLENYDPNKIFYGY